MNLSRRSHHDQLLRAQAVCQASSYTILIFVILLPRIRMSSAPTRKTGKNRCGVESFINPFLPIVLVIVGCASHIVLWLVCSNLCFPFLYWEGIQIQRETRPTQYTSVYARIFPRILVVWLLHGRWDSALLPNMQVIPIPKRWQTSHVTNVNIWWCDR